MRGPLSSGCPGPSWTFPGLSLRLPWALPEHLPVQESDAAGKEFAAREEDPPLITSWTQVAIHSHLDSSVLLGNTQHLATQVHEQVPWLQMVKEVDHVKVSRNAFSHHEIVVVPGEFVIDCVSFGGSKSTSGTNSGLLASS